MNIGAVEATHDLAQFVASTTADELPSEVIEHALLVFADTVGVAVRGAGSPEVRQLAASADAGTEAVILHPRFPRGNVEDAVLLNSISASTTELDEGTRPTGHPAIHVVPPALARAQQRCSSGAECLTAIVLGYEVQARISRACRLHGSVHCHGNLGHAAAAAAVAKLAGWGADWVFAAMTGAAALSSATSYSLCRHGATVRNAAPAASGLTALMVERLVPAGFTTYGGSIGEIFGELLGEEFEPAALVEGLGKSFAVESGYVKFHATCGDVHPVLEALGDALPDADRARQYPWTIRFPFAPELIERVTVTVSRHGAEQSGLPEPRNAFAAKFSIPYATAAFLVHGHASASAFEGGAFEDPRVWNLAKRINVVADDAFDARFPEEHHAHVVVELADGGRFSGRCANPYGNPFNRASVEDVKQKFLFLTGEMLNDGESERLWEASTSLDRLPNLRSFPWG